MTNMRSALPHPHPRLQTNVTAAGECLIDTTQPECAAAWCDENRFGLNFLDKVGFCQHHHDENRVERDVDYDGPLAPVNGPWTENAPDAQVTSRFVLLILTTRPPV